MDQTVLEDGQIFLFLIADKIASHQLMVFCLMEI